MSSRTRADGTVAATSLRPGKARMVAGAVLIGAAAVAGLVAVRGPAGTTAWVVQRPVAAQAAVVAEDLAPAEVLVPDAAALWPGSAPPQGAATRSLTPGQPLMAADLSPQGTPDGRGVSLSLPPERLPASLRVGDRVDVWIGAGGDPQLLLPDVPVAGVLSDPALAARAQVDVVIASGDARVAVEAALADDVVLVRRS